MSSTARISRNQIYKRYDTPDIMAYVKDHDISEEYASLPPDLKCDRRFLRQLYYRKNTHDCINRKYINQWDRYHAKHLVEWERIAKDEGVYDKWSEIMDLHKNYTKLKMLIIEKNHGPVNVHDGIICCKY